MSQKIKTSVEIDGSLTASQIANATIDTDKFLVSDAGTIKYRTGAEMLSDLGIVTGTANHVQHQVKAGVAINKGQAVYVTSADGTNMIVGLASNASEATSSKTMGLLNATVAVNGFADVITEGLLSGLDTSTATIGNPVWLGTNGNLIYGLANKPSAPSHLVFIGIVTRVNANNGEIFVKVQNGFELDELHNVDLITTAPSGNDILAYEGNPVNLWKNKSIAAVLGYTPYNASNPAGYISSYTETDPTVPSYVKSITSTEKSNWNTAFGWGNHASAGYALSGHTHGLGRYSLRAPALIDSVTSSNFRTQLFGSSTSGYNISTARFNATPGLLSGLNNYGTMMAWSGYDSHGFLAIDYAGPAAIIGGGDADNINWTKRLAFLDDTVPNNRTITINGTSYDLSANRSWTVTASETDTLATVTSRGNVANYNIALGTNAAISGGGSAKWITTDGTVSYGGGLVSSLNGTAKAYYYYDGTNAVVQGAAGVGISFQPNNSSQATLNTSGDFTANASLRAPIFYDSNNTGYYVDPASTSNLNGLTVGNTITGSVSGSSGSVGGVIASQIVYGSGSSKVSSHSNANEWRNSGFYENDGGGSNWPSATWYNSINVRHSNQGNYHGFQVAMSYYDNNLWFRSYQGAGTFQSWQKAAVSRGEGSNYVDYSRYVYNNGAYSGSGWVEPSDLGVRYANSAGSATNATNSDNAGNLRTAYVGGVQSNPQTYFNYTIGLKAAMTGHWSVWSDTLWINGYSGGDVPNMCALHFLRNGTPRMAISAQSFSSSSYGTIYEVLSNYGGTGTYSTTGDFRAPIFYDTNDTGYYVDPASTSNLKFLQVGRPSNGQSGTRLLGGQGTSYGAITLDVDISNYGTGIKINNQSSTYANSAMAFFWNGSQCGGVSIGVNSTAYNTSSDYRLKENVVPIESPIARLKELNPCRFNFINEPSKTIDGFIAHEVQEIIPEAVTGTKDELDHDGTPKHQGIDQSKIVPLLTAALQEAIAKIEQLENRLSILENK